MEQVGIRPYLLKYFNTGSLDKTDIVLSYLNSSIPFIRNSNRIKKILETGNAVSGINTVQIQVKPYSGKNSVVEEINTYLNNNLKNDLKGAYVHGSLATQEEIAYSDFDGLVILKNEVLGDQERIKRVAMHLSRTYSLMIQFDSLQHHGWFVILESELKNFPVNYFPLVLFDYSASLLPGGEVLNIQYTDDPDGAVKSFRGLTRSITKKLQSDKLPVKMYSLKSILSEFMLLPAMFLQAKTGKGVFKKFSFQEASKYFKKDDWSIMDEISEIRNQWQSKETLQKKSNTYLVTPKIKKNQVKQSAEIPDNFKIVLSKEFRMRMLNLARIFEQSVP